MARRAKICPPKSYGRRFTPKQIINFLLRHDVDRKTGCWLFRGRLDENGYAQVNIHGMARTGARVAYAMFRGKIKAGNVVDHFRRNPSCPHNCDNPWHLRQRIELGNSRDGGFRRHEGPRAPVNGHKVKLPVVDDDIPF